MQITLKLYAGLSQYLPQNAEQNATRLQLAHEGTACSVLEKFNVPQESVHLVLLNGIYLTPEERRRTGLSDGDVLAVWPPVAGG